MDVVGERILIFVGQRFGQLVVDGVGTPYVHKERSYRRWRCRCDCGETTEVIQARLRSGNKTSCGCRERAAAIPVCKDRYEVEGIHLSYVASRVLGVIGGIEPGPLDSLLARPRVRWTIRTLIKHGLIDDGLKLTLLGERFVTLVRKPITPSTEIFEGLINFGDPRLPRRFWNKAIVEPGTGCWIWTASKHKRGYGQFGVGSKGWRAHRAAYLVLRGPVADDLELDHVCKTPSCVNPNHLEPVAHSENVRRGWADRKIESSSMTTCKVGHPLDLSNTVYSLRGGRSCLTCRRAKDREVQQARRDKAKQPRVP